MRRIIEARSSRSNSLKLVHLNLSSLPQQIWELTDLTILNLVGNKLTMLPEQICKLTSLESLDISINYLTPSPALLGRLFELETGGCQIHYPGQITLELRVEVESRRLQKSRLQLELRTLSLANLDPGSNLNKLDTGTIKEVMEFTTDTSQLSEEEKKKIFKAAERDLKETERYKKHAELVTASPTKVIKSEETEEEKYKSDYEDGDEESRLSEERPSSGQASHQGAGGAAAQDGEETSAITGASGERAEEPREVATTRRRTFAGRVCDSLSSIFPKTSMFTTTTSAQPLQNKDPLTRE